MRPWAQTYQEKGFVTDCTYVELITHMSSDDKRALIMCDDDAPWVLGWYKYVHPLLRMNGMMLS